VERKFGDDNKLGYGAVEGRANRLPNFLDKNILSHYTDDLKG
jgi:hypothetical protein